MDDYIRWSHLLIILAIGGVLWGLMYFSYQFGEISGVHQATQVYIKAGVFDNVDPFTFEVLNDEAYGN